MTDVFDTEKATDEELERYIGMMKIANKMMRDKLAEHSAKIVNAESEQSRRQLAAYWKANPQLTALAVGDKVVITPEYQHWYSRKWHEEPNSKIGEVATISGFELKHSIPVEFYLAEYGGMSYLPIELAQQMRAAFLAAESEGSDG